MLKKGQSRWIDNAKPHDTGPQIVEHLRVRHKNKGKKRYGIAFNKRKRPSTFRFDWRWKQWYYTSKDRDEAMRTIAKKGDKDFINKYYSMESIER